MTPTNKLLSLLAGSFIALQCISLTAMGWSPSTPQHMEAGQNTAGTWYDQRIAQRGVIYFYDNGKPYYEFTNFFDLKTPVRIDGFTWPTTEQYYQAGKYTDNSLRNLIRTGSDKNWSDKKPHHKSWGAWAFYIANQADEVEKRATVRADWFSVIPALGMQRNINRMLVALRAKFNQDRALAKQLLDTYPAVLVEDSNKDGYFGAGNPQGKTPVAQGMGENLLGRMLMHVRKELYRKLHNIPNPERPFDVANDFSLASLLGGGKI